MADNRAGASTEDSTCSQRDAVRQNEVSVSKRVRARQRLATRGYEERRRRKTRLRVRKQVGRDLPTHRKGARYTKKKIAAAMSQIHNEDMIINTQGSVWCAEEQGASEGRKAEEEAKFCERACNYGRAVDVE